MGGRRGECRDCGDVGVEAVAAVDAGQCGQGVEQGTEAVGRRTVGGIRTKGRCNFGVEVMVV